MQVIHITPPKKAGSNTTNINAVSLGYTRVNFTVEDHIRAYCSRATNNFSIVLPAVSPKVTAVKKKIQKLSKEHEKVMYRLDELYAEKQKMSRATKTVKAKLTRNLLESTPEGRMMIKKLDKIKGKVIGQAMLTN